ncbi:MULTISPECIES: TonB-dependent receptor [unclassified Rhodanobacter]|uniref:TonB-dependent receptor plug domain-containing protein n=1 Tax=unclassified Rhodanobacter TaxID=2621553 RepID=UPI001BE0E716|nr:MULTISPECIES: TonB-dependent receptor [unclassified Rhodanobacter]MBT2145151.1 TonB-dependent receptor [Rhodanobacter sp. LX-99]MBT2149196.1 TonB-dependent receptor [Rhodanobacter sp. LX-100]
MLNHTGVNVVLLRAVRAALAAATLLACSAQAQDPGASDSRQATARQASGTQERSNAEKEKSTTNLQEVVVTGTHRAGLSPTESISPIDAFSGSQIANQPSADLTDALTNIVPSLTTQRFPIADGTAFVRPVSLRNLSPDQTLVLVDGVRFHRSALVNLQIDPLGTFNQGAQAVDFSVFPSNAIERVEVLRDGASVLYGSDAIAGVVNVILKKAPTGVTVSAELGKYGKGDGNLRRYDADAGLPLGTDGFVHVSAERETTDPTSRGVPQGGAAAVAAVVGANLVPYDGLGQRWGDPQTKTNKLFVNAGLPLTGDVQLYGYGSFMDKKVLSSFFYRNPVLSPQYGISGRSTLVSYADGTLTPADAPQSLVDSIVAGGGNPANYLTANAASPSGWVLLNPIYTKFPGGYSPLFGADIADHQLVGGVRGGGQSNLQWDVHYRTGSNEVDYRLQGSINPSLGSLSPTSFRPGKLTQREQGAGADFVRSFDNSPLTLAFGAQWRQETYIIHQGDPGSTEVGPTASVFGVGSDAFQGFPANAAGRFTQNSDSAYFDAETNLTDKWSGAAAVRYEHADGYGSKVVYKLSSRYAFTDAFALRGTYNTGFRTPTPGQANTLNVTTTANAQGGLIPSGTYPVDNPVARALGSTPLKTETSKSLSVGAVWTPVDNLTTTLDYYRIRIDDRIGLVSNSVTQATVDQLAAGGYPNAQLLLGSDASYFGNAFGSDIHGIDFVVDTRHQLGNGTLNVDFRYNRNTQNVVKVQPDTLNNDFVYDLEHQVPKSRSVLSFDYGLHRFDAIARINHYGGWSTTVGLFGSNNPPDDVNHYSGKTLLDLEARYKFNDTFSVAVGGNNVFNTYPGKEQNGTLQFLGVKYALTSPFGFNGAFWYVRMTASF